MDLLAAEDLEVHQVQVDGTGIPGDVPDLPLLGAAKCRILRRRAVPGMEPFIEPTRPVELYTVWMVPRTWALSVNNAVNRQ